MKGARYHGKGGYVSRPITRAAAQSARARRRRAEALDRKQRETSNSVFTVSGGLPSLGKRR